MSFFSNIKTRMRFLISDDVLSQLSSEDKRKRVYVVLIVALSIPFLLGFGLYSLIALDDLPLALPDLVIAAFFIVTLYQLKNKVQTRFTYRVLMSGFSLLLIYNVAVGLYAGSDALWVFIYPLVAFFIFGILEGAIWTSLVVGTAILFVLFPDLFNSYNFAYEYRIRFVISLLVVSVLASLLESLRAHFYNQLQEQKDLLQKAVEEIYTLKRLIPICATCKKLKDDKGYWQDVDHYFHTHSNYELSHGICNSCLKDANPKVYDRLLSEGKIKE